MQENITLTTSGMKHKILCSPCCPRNSSLRKLIGCLNIMETLIDHKKRQFYGEMSCLLDNNKINTNLKQP
jgi:nitrogenase subunit NifH